MNRVLHIPALTTRRPNVAHAAGISMIHRSRCSFVRIPHKPRVGTACRRRRRMRRVRAVCTLGGRNLPGGVTPRLRLGLCSIGLSRNKSLLPLRTVRRWLDGPLDARPRTQESV